MDNDKNRGFYVGPMVYFGTYPLPLPVWEKIFGSQMDEPEGNYIEKTSQNYFSLPFPEDQE